jgi:hypothetical protein
VTRPKRPPTEAEINADMAAFAELTRNLKGPPVHLLIDDLGNYACGLSRRDGCAVAPALITCPTCRRLAAGEARN